VRWREIYAMTKVMDRGGTRQGAKASVDITYWPKALAQDAGLTTQARVREITVRPDGLADGVLYVVRGFGPVGTALGGVVRQRVPWGTAHRLVFDERFDRTITLAVAIPPLSNSSGWRDSHRSRAAITWNPWISTCWTTSSSASPSTGRYDLMACGRLVPQLWRLALQLSLTSVPTCCAATGARSPLRLLHGALAPRTATAGFLIVCVLYCGGDIQYPESVTSSQTTPRFVTDQDREDPRGTSISQVSRPVDRGSRGPYPRGTRASVALGQVGH
jgi:hypothetical protein